MNDKPYKPDFLREAAVFKLAHARPVDEQVQPAEKLLQELRVYQVELEMQNEVLRQSQLDLEESRDRYVDFYDFAPTGYITLNHEGMIHEINLTGATLLGIERNKILTRRFAPFVATENRDRWHFFFQSVLKTPIKLACELPLLIDEGKYIYAHLDCLRLLKKDKKPEVRIVITDITERHLLEDSLREREERYRTLIEQAADGIFLADSQGHYIDVNSAGCNMLGYTREEVLKLTFLDVLDPAEIPRLSSQVVNLTTGELIVNEWQFLRKDGSTFICELRGKQLANGNFQGILIDVTNRKQTENAIRANDQRLKAHIENSPLAVVSWDKDFIVTQWAGEAENIFGWSEGETVGKQLMNLNMIYAEDVPLVQKTMAKLFEANERCVISSNRNVTKDGRVIHCIWYNSILCDKHGEMESVMSLVLDVTEQKQNEEKIYHLAFYDSLTGLPNRRLLDDRIEQSIAACKRSRKYGAVLFLDLDNFKLLNDTHGHKEGDLLLVEVASRLTNCVREVDTVARLGGDEFVVVLSELDAVKTDCIKQSKLLAEKILSTLSQHYLLSSNSTDSTKKIVYSNVSASIGLALFNGDSSVEETLKYADDAMYDAKERGRNLICFYKDNI